MIHQLILIHVCVCTSLWFMLHPNFKQWKLLANLTLRLDVGQFSPALGPGNPQRHSDSGPRLTSSTVWFYPKVAPLEIRSLV